MPRILSFFMVSLIFILSGCQQTPFRDYPQGAILTVRNEKIDVVMADNDARQVQGLSGIKSDQWGKDRGMLFVYQQEGIRKFWMPDTYFALDIFFLSETLKVLHVERDIAAHPGKDEPPAIARTPPIFAFHVLELRSDSALAKTINPGEQLRWQGPELPQQTLPDTHLQK